MNNIQMNFDPMTGQPINQKKNNINNGVTNQTQTVPVQPQPIPTINPVETVSTPQPMPIVEPIQPVPAVETPQQNINQNVAINTQQQMQNIPTVEQSKQEFINNTQTNNIANNEEKKSSFNITFIVILFIIIFAAIFFLFPYLIKVL